MSITEDYVLDCSMPSDDGVFCFCPIEFNEDGSISSIVTGLNFISTEPPPGGYFVGVVHEGGQEMCDEWCAEHEEFLNDLHHRRGRKQA